MKKINILITGGHGYIGKNIVENLKDKHNLFSPTHKELDLLDEFRVEHFLKRKKIDIAIHAAVAGGSRKEEFENKMFYNNIRMFFNLIKNKKYFKKMIFFGSGAEYDKSRPIIKIKEDKFDGRVPIDDYGYYKYLCSKYIENVDCIISLRIFGLYGKYEDYRYRFISEMMCRNILGLPMIINQNAYFDYVYINDFVKIVNYFIQNDSKEKFYNIGRGIKIDLLTIAKTINKIAEKPSKIIVKKPGLNNEYTCDNKRLINEIKRIEFTDFNDSLIELYKWYKSIKKDLNKNYFKTDR